MLVLWERRVLMCGVRDDFSMEGEGVGRGGQMILVLLSRR